MNPLPLSQIAQFAGASLSSGDGSVMIDKLSTDSRTLKPGELFVALRGENFDGHNFVQAAAKLAHGAIVDSGGGERSETFAFVGRRHFAGVPNWRPTTENRSR
jgi:UDP-N-acetylmuramyl pentapeptide synthase